MKHKITAKQKEVYLARFKKHQEQEKIKVTRSGDIFDGAEVAKLDFTKPIKAHFITEPDGTLRIMLTDGTLNIQRGTCCP